MRTVLCSILFLGSMATATTTHAQTASRPAHEVDLAIVYSPEHRDGTNGRSFWDQGGGVEFSADIHRGLGVAADFTANRASNINGSGVNLTTYTSTFGPRYTWSRHKLAVFGDGLFGVSVGVGSVFPAPGAALQTSHSFAVQAGGGFDWHLSPHIAVRPVEASWLRTQFPNGTTNVQNTLQLSAGIVFRLRR